MKGLRWWIVGYLIALAVTLAAPLASSSPDGFERVAEDKGYIEQAREAPYEIIADYVFPGIENEALATILGGMIGVTIVFMLAGGGTYLLYKAAGARKATT